MCSEQFREFDGLGKERPGRDSTFGCIKPITVIPGESLVWMRDTTFDRIPICTVEYKGPNVDLTGSDSIDYNQILSPNSSSASGTDSSSSRSDEKMSKSEVEDLISTRCPFPSTSTAISEHLESPVGDTSRRRTSGQSTPGRKVHLVVKKK